MHVALVEDGGSGSRKLIQVLSLLVGVLLEQGLVKEAEEYAKKASGVQFIIFPYVLILFGPDCLDLTNHYDSKCRPFKPAKEHTPNQALTCHTP